MGLVFTYLRLVMSLRGCEAPVAIRNTLCSFSLLSPAACFSSSFLFLCLRRVSFSHNVFCLRRHTFCQQQQKAFTVVSADFQPRCGVKNGTLTTSLHPPQAALRRFPPKTNGFWISFPFKSRVQYGPVKGIDSATDPLPLWWRKCCVYRWGDPFPTVEQHVPSNSQCSGSVSRNTSIPCFGRT